VAFHPLKPALLSTSGSRHFTEQEDFETDSSSSENDEVIIPANKNRPVRRSKRPHPVTLDSTIKIWDLKWHVHDKCYSACMRTAQSNWNAHSKGCEWISCPKIITKSFPVGLRYGIFVLRYGLRFNNVPNAVTIVRLEAKWVFFKNVNIHIDIAIVIFDGMKIIDL